MMTAKLVREIGLAVTGRDDGDRYGSLRVWQKDDGSYRVELNMVVLGEADNLYDAMEIGLDEFYNEDDVEAGYDF